MDEQEGTPWGELRMRVADALREFPPEDRFAVGLAWVLQQMGEIEEMVEID